MAEKKAPSKGPAAKAARSKAEPSAREPASAEAGPAKVAPPRTAARARVPQKVQNPYSHAKPRTTFVPSDSSKIERRWFLVDATGLTLGRAASRIASILRGKHKPIYTPHVDTGDHVIVVNAEKVKLTGNKESQKPYYRHSMHPGGLKTALAREVRIREPTRLIQDAVRRMIARNPLGRDMVGKLHVYAGPAHPHHAQKPEPLSLA